MTYAYGYRGYTIMVKATNMIEHTEQGMPLGYCFNVFSEGCKVMHSSRGYKTKAWALRKAKAEINIRWDGPYPTEIP